MKNIFTKEEVLALNSILKFIHDLAVAMCGADRQSEKDEFVRALRDVERLRVKLKIERWEEDDEDDWDDYDEEDFDEEDFDEDDEEEDFDEEDDDDDFDDWDLMEG